MPSGNPVPAAGPGAELQVTSQLSAEEAGAALGLVQRAAEEDGVGPLSEHVMLHLRYGGDPQAGEPQARDVLAWQDGQLAGYGHLDLTDPVEGPSGEMLIDPPARRQGLGLALVRALIAEAGPQRLRLWAHGDLPAASRLAAAAGFRRTRSLWQMRRSLTSQIDRPRLADGITVRTFAVGRDEDAWIELNRKAFASHPEQGSWTRADLDLREREPWFDPAGFFLAERDGALAGFHWTKVHQAAGGAIGEVYVVGVDPGERGTGLGRALTLTGLRYLRGRGLFQVMLYVDGDNTPAIRLYESLGFTRWDTDVMFTRAGQA
ncbi:MAG TPA: mycothiol synthase [Streptosporangiaceae bacterium]|nr:mycothiol synthase [Streptosporangiaceae bacterium]